VHLPGGEDEPIFRAGPVHFRSPEISDIAAFRRPFRFLALWEGKAEALPMEEIARVQDRERVWRIVGGRDEPIVLAVLEHRWVAVTDENPRCDILGQQWLPGNGRRRVLDAFPENVRHSSAEIVAQFAVEVRKILLRVGWDAVAPGPF